jgi:hypothetical protein
VVNFGFVRVHSQPDRAVGLAEADAFAVSFYLRSSAVGLVFLLTPENAYWTVAGRYAEQ